MFVRLYACGHCLVPLYNETTFCSQLLYMIIRVEDGGGLYVDGNTTIVVRDSDHAPEFNDTGTRLLWENVAIGTDVGRPLGVFDRDPGQVLAFSIIGADWSGALSLFAIDPAHGQLKTTGLIDFEAFHGHFYVLVIAVQDNPTQEFGTPPIRVTFNVTISVVDRNDAPVLFSENVTLPENVPNGTVVATMTCFDQDRWHQSEAFAIVAGNFAGLFTVDRWSGVVTVSRPAVNYELVPVWNLTLSVTDNGTNPGPLSGFGT
jgi:Cadherin domain